MMIDAKKVVAPLWATILLAGCTVNPTTEDTIVLRHFSGNDVAVQFRADAYCEGFGKSAVRVQRSSISTENWFGTVETTFRCVAAEKRQS